MLAKRDTKFDIGGYADLNVDLKQFDDIKNLGMNR